MQSVSVIAKLAAALPILLALAGAPAHAETLAPAVVSAVIEGPTLESSTLIGTSGQVYEPREAGGWKRVGRGGVACRVSAAFRIGSDFWALCSSAPLFRRRDNVWSAEPLNNRGRTRAARLSAKPIISVGRHLYGFVGGKWERLSSAPGTIRSLLATSATSALAVTTRREVIRLEAKRRKKSAWKVVVAPPKRRKPADDLPISLFGSAANAYVVTDSGALFRLAGKRMRAVRLPRGVSSFTVRSSCAEASGGVLAVGVSAGTASGQTLLRFNGQSAKPVGALPELAANEKIVVLHCLGDKALLSTDEGRVFVRAADGSWTTHTIDAAPPAETKKARAGAGPAKTQ